MQKRRFPRGVLTVVILLLLGIGFACYGGGAWAQDYYLLSVTFGWPEASKDIKVLLEIYEYTPGMAVLGPPLVRLVTNTNSGLNTPQGPLRLPLPRNRKFLIKAEPLAGRLSNQGPYQVKEANYQSQFYSKNHTFEEAIENKNIIDTSGSSGTISISLEGGFKIRGSLKTCESNSAIEGVTIKVFDENQIPVARFGKSSSTGDYTIYGLSPGKYYLLADGAAKGYIRKFYKSGVGTDTIDSAELVEITDSDITGKDFCLKKGYSITGRLLDPNGSLLKHGATVYLVDATYSVPVGWYFYDPNSGAYDEYAARLNYYLSGGMLDFSYSKNDPNYFIGGLDPNYSIGGAPKGAGGECVLLGVDPAGVYAPLVYKDHYFVADGDHILLKNIAPDSNFDLQFRRAGTIEGSVRDKEGKPLGHITVKAIDASDETKVIQPVAYTDPNTGQYKLIGLPQMDYKIQVVDELNHQYLWQYYNQKLSFAQAATISVTDQNLNISNINFELEIGGKITGQILDSVSHAPIAGAAIQAFRIGTGSPLMNYPVATTASGAAISDATGAYEISGLPSGQYVLYTRPPVDKNYIAVFYQDSETLNDADPNIVIQQPGQVISSRDFLLKPGGIVYGQITGIPAYIKSSLIRNIHVDLTEAKTGRLMQATTEVIDPNTFKYEITGIPKGEYKIGITDTRMPPQMLKKYYNKENATSGVFSYKEASTFEIDPTSDPVEINFNWDAVGESIKGKVLEGGSGQKPLSNIRIDAYKVEEASGKVRSIGIYSYTNTSGTYLLTGLATGTYVLKASDEMKHIYPPQFYDPNNKSFSLDTAKRITIPPVSADVSFDFKLNSQLGIINGMVTKGIEKAPDVGSLVYLYLGEDDGILQSVRTDADGRYSFTGLAEGSYKIQAFASDAVYVPRFYTSNSLTYAFNRADGETVSVNYASPLSSTHKDIALDKQGAQIQGKVRSSEDNSSLPGIFIYLYYQGEHNQWSFVSDYHTTTVTDANGDYFIKGLAEGTYKALAWEYSNTYVPTEQEFTLGQGGQVVVDFSLPKVAPASETKYSLTLNEGLNLFCFPTRVPLWPALYNANNLMTDWSTATESGIANLLHFDTEKGEWENRLSSFLIENGKGYVVYSQKNKAITYFGALFPASGVNFTIDLQKGMNIVGNIKANAPYDSYQMVKKLSNGISGLRSYDPITGKWLSSTLFWGKCGGDKFSIYPTRGYIVDMRKPHLSWLP